jgi:hypothetical protein
MWKTIGNEPVLVARAAGKTAVSEVAGAQASDEVERTMAPDAG